MRYLMPFKQRHFVDNQFETSFRMNSCEFVTLRHIFFADIGYHVVGLLPDVRLASPCLLLQIHMGQVVSTWRKSITVQSRWCKIVCSNYLNDLALQFLGFVDNWLMSQKICCWRNSFEFDTLRCIYSHRLPCEPNLLNFVVVTQWPLVKVLTRFPSSHWYHTTVLAQSSPRLFLHDWLEFGKNTEFVASGNSGTSPLASNCLVSCSYQCAFITVVCLHLLIFFGKKGIIRHFLID